MGYSGIFVICALNELFIISVLDYRCHVSHKVFITTFCFTVFAFVCCSVDTVAYLVSVVYMCRIFSTVFTK